MKVAVEGCAHGELDNIYDTIKSLEEAENIKIDLLLCCGDFQSARNMADLSCMAVPAKYNSLRTFYKYYNGEKTAPVLTIFIGGNHEASNYLQELPYGGWVAPNIFYLGYAGVVNFGGIRIAGVSGIYKGRDYSKGHYEVPPYSQDTIRTVYHTRNLEVFRLKQLSGDIDIFLSHDWPSDVFKHGNLNQLLKYKPYFKDDIESEQIGSPPLQELMRTLQPKYWFAAHLHCKFAAVVPHENNKITKFLALDKCLPNKRFLQLIDIPHDTNKKLELCYDAEWLAILNLTNNLLSIKNVTNYMPGPNSSDDKRFIFTPSQAEIDYITSKMQNDLVIPLNFTKTAREHTENNKNKQVFVKLNPQTQEFCSKVVLDDPVDIIVKLNNIQLQDDDFIEKHDDSSQKNDDSFSLNSSVEFTRTSLSLPAPKVIFEDNEDDLKSLDSSAVSFDTSKDETKAEEVKITPGKFKRRNASLYENENE